MYTDLVNEGDDQISELDKNILLGRIKVAKIDDPEYAEKFASFIIGNHPEWVDTPEKRRDFGKRVFTVNIGKRLMLDSEIELISNSEELNPRIRMYEDGLKEIGGFNNLLELAQSGKILDWNEKPIQCDDTQQFMRRAIHSIINYGGINIKNDDGSVQPYIFAGDLGFTKCMRREEYHSCLKGISDLIPESDSEEISEIRKQVRDALFVIENRKGYVLEKTDSIEKKGYGRLKLENIIPTVKDLAEEYVKLHASAPEDTPEGKMLLASKMLGDFCNGISKNKPGIRRTFEEKYPGKLSPIKEKEKPKPAEPKGKINFKAYNEEIKRLKSELEKTDSRLSDDSPQYVNLCNMLAKWENLDSKTIAVDEITSAEMKKLVKYTKSACEDYMTSHQVLDELSSRQQRRLKTINRILDVCDMGDSCIKNPRENREVMLASKLVQNESIIEQNLYKGSKPGTENHTKYLRAKNVQLDRFSFNEKMRTLLVNPVFKAFTKDMDNRTFEKLIKTDGQKAYKQYLKFESEFKKTRQPAAENVSQREAAPEKQNDIVLQ